ncbi:MAG TPA: glycosyltransferase family 2 protein [Thermoanaerobaculia bacterium]|nr:glycosyltransferase family 2 protein [Thermoanaerobaculia bacterium]
MRTEIIVPTFGQEGFTARCFDSIREHTADYRLVWVDNGSSRESRMAVLRSFARHESRLSIWPGRNLGFVGGTNLGLRAVLETFPSEAEHVVLLNNDTEVTAGWIQTLTSPLRDPTVAAAGPMTSCAGSWQGWSNVFGHWGERTPDWLPAAGPDEVRRYLAQRYGNTVFPVSMIAFFCAAFRKEVFERVGLLDPQFGTGLGDDDDYCFRLRQAGYTLAFMPGAYVVHHHRTTFKAVYSEAEILRMQTENLSKYHQKHGILLGG